MTRFIDVATMADLVAECGLETFLGDLADALAADFVRWPEFDKSARVASHSEVGVIELMPAADRQRYQRLIDFFNGK